MKEPKILPEGTTVHNIRRLSSRILHMYLYYHLEDDDLRRAAKDEMNLRLFISREYIDNHIRYSVEEMKQKNYNTEFSDSLDTDDEFFW